MHLISQYASWHLTIGINYSWLLSFCKRSAQQLVFGCPRSGRHGSELSDSTAACGVQSEQPHAVSCNHVALGSVSNPDRSAMSKMTSCTEAAPG